MLINMRCIQRKLLTYVVGGVLSCTALGCGSSLSLQEAQKFGAMASRFEENTNKLADDIYNSCVRRTRYYQLDTSDGNDARNRALTDCEELNKPASDKARDANKIVVDYIKAIGGLASDEVIAFDDELDKLTESLNNFSIPIPRDSQRAAGEDTTRPLSSDEFNSGLSIARFIFRWATNDFREGTLREAITCTEQPFQIYTSGLEATFRQGYIEGILEQELFRVNSYYDAYAALLRAANGTDIEFRQLEGESFSAVETVLQRRNAAFSYISIIDDTAEAHSKLAKLFLDGAAPPTESSCATYFNISNSDSISIGSEEQISRGFTLTNEELVKVREIMIEYQEKVEPSLIQMENSFVD